MTTPKAQFTTQENIVALCDEGYVPDMQGDGQCGQCGVNWRTMLAEREAYRELAIKNQYDWCKAVGCPLAGAENHCEDEVDAEATRILEEKK